MFGTRLPKSRSFNYTPSYYDPEKEEREGTKIKFKRNRSKQMARQRSLIWLFFLLAAALYGIFILMKIGK